jgi:hypothetical protein
MGFLKNRQKSSFRRTKAIFELGVLRLKFYNIFFGEFFVYGKSPFKLEVKVSAHSRGPVVNRTTFVSFYGTENRARWCVRA